MAKIILTTHQKGGVGKSTLTLNLALNLNSSAKVCIVDMDHQGSLLRLQELSEVDILPASDLQKAIDGNYDIIFIDTPPYLNKDLPKLCKKADMIVIPTKAGILDLLAIQSTIAIVENVKAQDRALIVFNMVKPNTSLTAEMKEQLTAYKVKVSDTMISDLVSFSRSVLLNGVDKDPKAQSQMDSLSEEILNLIITK